MIGGHLRPTVCKVSKNLLIGAPSPCKTCSVHDCSLIYNKATHRFGLSVPERCVVIDYGSEEGWAGSEVGGGAEADAGHDDAYTGA